MIHVGALLFGILPLSIIFSLLFSSMSKAKKYDFVEDSKGRIIFQIEGKKEEIL